MNKILILSAALCFAGVSAEEWKNLHVKFDVLDGYFQIPTIQSELANKYVPMAVDDDLQVTWYSLPNDPRVSFGVDKNGNIAGVRNAYIKNDVGTRAQSNGLTFPTSLFENNKMFGSATYWDQDVWYNTILFVSPDKLKTGGRVDTQGLVAEDVYMKLDGETWTRLPRMEADAVANGFYEQGCFAGMGKHYFYGLKKDGTCEAAPGIFLLYENGEMIGLGLIPYGSFTNGDQQNWFEDPPAPVAKMIAPNSPDCMTEWISNYGTSSFHIFFKKHPRLTFCPLF